MPTSADTYAVAQAIVALVTPLQVNAQPAYANLVAGEFKDLTDMVPCFECYTADDLTARASITMTLGSADTLEIFDDQTFWLVSTVDMTDASVAWQQLWAIRDVLTQAVHASLRLKLAGVTFTALEPRGVYEPVYRNGVWWLMHRIPARVRYEYTTAETA